jgi:SNF2 family DNA or RNA helicase
MNKQPVTLLPHQEEAKQRLQKQHGLILNWQVGSGKTIGAIAAADQFGSTEAVVPASLRENFKKELRTFKPSNKFHVDSYEKFVKNPDVKDKVVVFDEAHRLRTADSQRSRVAQGLTNQAKKVLLLTGTPIQNAPHEIAPLVNIAAGHQVLPTSEKAFNDRYLSHVKTNPGPVLSMLGFKKRDEYVPKNLGEFASKVKPYFMNYKPEDSPESPRVRHIKVDVPMSHTQQAVYNVLEKQLPGELKKDIENSLPADKKNMSRLNAFLSATRQVSNTSERFYNTGKKEYSPKLLNIAKYTAKSPGNSLIYSNYLESGTQPLSELLTAAGVRHGIFTGKANDVDRKKMVKDYNSGKIKALIVSSSGGEGLDLKGTRQVHITEPHWNEEKINQVIGRSVRIGSHAHLPIEDRTVDVYKYNSVLPEKRTGFLWLKKTRPVSADQYLDNLATKKKQLNNTFLNAITSEKK